MPSCVLWSSFSAVLMHHFNGRSFFLLPLSDGVTYKRISVPYGASFFLFFFAQDHFVSVPGCAHIVFKTVHVAAHRGHLTF